jgi:hypothetical protein
MIVALAAALLLQQTPAPSAPAETEAGDLVCRIYAGSGTRFTKRVCLTPQQWTSYREAVEQQRMLVRPPVDNRRPFPGPGRRR